LHLFPASVRLAFRGDATRPRSTAGRPGAIGGGCPMGRRYAPVGSDRCARWRVMAHVCATYAPFVRHVCATLSHSGENAVRIKELSEQTGPRSAMRELRGFALPCSAPSARRAEPFPSLGAPTLARSWRAVPAPAPYGDDGVSGDRAGGSAGVAGTDSQGRMDLPSRPWTPEWLTRG
jgi:hypothetical protein